MDKIRVLVFPAGEINSLEVHDALSNCVNVEVFGASSIERHGAYLFKNYISGLPMLDEPDFIPKFRDILKENRIDLVFPTHDTVAEFLSAHADSFPSRILGGDARTSAICRDKAKTYREFADESFCPRIYAPGDDLPVFVKPRKGQGSQGAKIISTLAEVEKIHPAEYVITEYLPGEEYTVDCLTDNEGNLRVVSPRSRKRVMAGISMAGQTEQLDPEIANIARTLNSRLNFIGLWWFQIKKDRTDHWKLLEISVRCAGTMILTRALGINLPLLSVYVAMGKNIEILPNDYQARMDSAILRRFKLPIKYSVVYLDYDDTLIVNGKVNLKAIWFIYQCRNEGIKIILLTRHENDLAETFAEYGICSDLFSEIIHLGWDERKCDKILNTDCIFIDNAWSEREQVRKNLGLPVFDVDGLDFLMSWVS